jgi:hypothetical protein
LNSAEAASIEITVNGSTTSGVLTVLDLLRADIKPDRVAVG